MANVLLAYNNRTDASTLSGGSWRPTLPLTNLQSRVLGKVARTTDLLLASTKFDADVGVDKAIRVISLVTHNFSLSALYRIRGSDDPTFATSTYDSDWQQVWPAVYDMLEWEAPNYWTSQYLPEEIDGFNLTFVKDLGQDYALRYWRIELDDTTNTAGFLQMGRLFMGAAFQPRINMSYNASLAWETDTDIQKALSGAEYFNRRIPYRVARFVTEWMDEDEGMASAFDLQGRSGIDKEVVMIWNPEDTVHAVRRQFLGRLRQLSQIEFPMVDVTKIPWEIKELI